MLERGLLSIPGACILILIVAMRALPGQAQNGVAIDRSQQHVLESLRRSRVAGKTLDLNSRVIETRLVRDIHPGPGSSSPSDLTPLGRTLFFFAEDGVHGRELYWSDGTESGTRLVRDINRGRGDGAFGPACIFAGKLYFAASDGLSGIELWRSDGTDAGTSIVKDIVAGSDSGLPASSFPHSFTILDHSLYFIVRLEFGRYSSLWRTDGTPAGTSEVVSGQSNAGYGRVTELAVFDGALVFATDRGLWRTDGTAGGTTLIKTLWRISGLTDAGGILLFSAEESPAGPGLWRSDGTESGTVLVTPTNDGAGRGYGPAQLTRVGRRPSSPPVSRDTIFGRPTARRGEPCC